MAKRTFTDQMGREIEVSYPPKKIVSLVPSQTELLFDLNLNDTISALTKFCIHPNKLVVNKEIIGGTKTLKLDKIASIGPDLIIANKEENTRSEIEALAADFPVWISDIQTLDQALEMIRSIGELTNTEEKARQMEDSIRSNFEGLRPLKKTLSVVYLIWRNPYMTINSETFIHDMLVRMGLTNLFDDAAERYPEISESELAELNPDVVLLSSEPYPFGDKHIRELSQILPKSRIELVDGELFSWYGSRLLHSPDYFKKLGERLSNVPENYAPRI
ncbi:MAG: ABC transporter substrate-binding protein [Bacteroidia bacterium]|jgi:ABC-type Fe3+-hydroxamate transport system substrate-binding protein